jgi:uncharacterized protein RhaS with RHS repeats
LVPTTSYLWSAAVDELLAVDILDDPSTPSVNETQLLWTLNDHQGTLRDIYSAADQDSVTEGIQPLLKHIKYDPLGTPLDEDPNDIVGRIRIRFAGDEYDVETGYHLDGSVHYSTQFGRYLSPVQASKGVSGRLTWTRRGESKAAIF